MELRTPSAVELPAYVAALSRGWSPNTMRPEAAVEELAWIERSPATFLAAQTDRLAEAPPITLADGSTVPRIPSIRRWMWEDDFVGSIDVDNVASQRVILANGGVEVERFRFPDSHGGNEGIRYRISLDDAVSG